MTVFDDLIGQEAAVAQLRRAVAAAASGGPGFTHAWLFTGPPGSGRSVAARAFAAALQCREGGCGHCDACHTVLLGSHADVDVVVPQGLHLKIAEAREIVARAARVPSRGRWQITLIEDADRMEERTSNTLLKAIEEPPPHGVFLLCAPSPDDLLPTIRSRCQLVTLRTPAPAAVADMLVASAGVDRGMAMFAARAAQGHVGRARRLATDDAARRRRRDALALPTALVSVGACFEAAQSLVAASDDEAVEVSAPLDAAETAALRQALGDGATSKGGAKATVRGADGQLKELERRQKSRATRAKRDALDRALTDLAAFYRDVLLCQTGAFPAGVELVHVDLSDQVQRVARASTPVQTLRRIEAVLACRERVDANVPPLLAVEEMALALHAG